MSWGFTSTGSNGTFTFYVGTSIIPEPVRCACGGIATHVLRNGQTGEQRRVCQPCGERAERDGAIEAAPRWLAVAFQAVGRDQRSRLYKQLAIVFHPDQGGDERLMTALNAVRERFPS